jgi:hypothetical protein
MILGISCKNKLIDLNKLNKALTLIIKDETTIVGLEFTTQYLLRKIFENLENIKNLKIKLIKLLKDSDINFEISEILIF